MSHNYHLPTLALNHHLDLHRLLDEQLATYVVGSHRQAQTLTGTKHLLVTCLDSLTRCAQALKRIMTIVKATYRPPSNLLNLAFILDSILPRARRFHKTFFASTFHMLVIPANHVCIRLTKIRYHAFMLIFAANRHSVVECPLRCVTLSH